MTRLSRRRFLFASAAAIGAACSPAAPALTPAPTAAVPVAPSSAAPPLRIGVLLPYTESAVNGDIGAAQKKAADLYLKQHGGALGGRVATLIWSDESVDPAFNGTKVQLLVKDEKAEILLGGGSTPAAVALRAAAETAGIVYLATNASGDALTRSSRHTFRTSATSWQLSEPLGAWAARNGSKELFLAYDDTAFGAESASAFAEGLAKNGGVVAGRTSVPPGGDRTALVAAIKAQPVKSVYAAFVTDDAVAFLDAWDAQHMKAAGYRLFGPGPLADQHVLSLTKQRAVGVVTSTFWTSELGNAETKALVGAFRAEYTDEGSGGPLTPDAYAVEMWDAMRALDLALANTAGVATAGALIPALESISFASPRGAFRFNTAHGLTQDIHICEVRASGTSAVNAILDTIATVPESGT